MKPLFFILAVCCQFVCMAQGLLRFQENDKVGYMDSSGKVWIPAQYNNAGDFSENLAAVRANGLYGYINTKGEPVIQPQFEYATSFTNGYAIAYTDGKPFYIDKTGKKLFENAFPYLSYVYKNRAVACTESKHCALIDMAGNMLTDTFFKEFYIDTRNDVAMVTDIDYQQYEEKYKYAKLYGIIDLNGKFVVPYGRYTSISSFQNGYAVVHDDDKYMKRYGVITPDGKEVFMKDSKRDISISWYADGYFRISRYDEKTANGYMNLQGEETWLDTDITSATDFSDNRAFLKDSSDRYYIINKKLQRVGKQMYSYVYRQFEDGIVLAKKDTTYYIVDTNGRHLDSFQYDGIEDNGVINGQIIFSMRDPVKNATLYGMRDTKGQILIAPAMENYYYPYFHKGVMAAEINGRFCYIDKAGKTVWAMKNDEPTIHKLNIDHMKRGYFYAYSTKPENYTGHTQGASSRYSPDIITADNHFTAGKLSVVIRPTDTILENHVLCLGVCVANNTDADIHFNAQDGRLYMNMQAQDKNGKWKDIEYLPNSWCGNSYHNITLEAGLYWRLPMPVYEGSLKTKLRAKLRYREDHNKEYTIYSNVIDGTINPAQFWRKESYRPGGIMDPYNE